MKHCVRGVLASFIVALTVTDSATAQTGPAGPAGPTGPAGPLRSDPAAVERARADSMRRPYTEADISFISGMIAHHSQAIAMARLAPQRGAGDPVRRLAERIINAQQDEISLMRYWLLDRNRPVPDPDPRGLKMGTGAGEHYMLMPGMLPPEQLRSLEAARGDEFDRLFLTFMIEHHRGAVQMVRNLFTHPGAGQDETVWRLASDINADQTTEIARMQRMLASVTLGIPARYP